MKNKLTMASAIAKLRKEFKNVNDELKKIKIERIPVKHDIKPVTAEKAQMIEEIIKNKKMTIDNVKLETTIQKASVPIKKKEIVVLDFIPKTNVPESTPVVKTVEICKALNLNGTPCKCRAKIGKFCAKHAP